MPEIIINEILGGLTTMEHYSSQTEFLFSSGIDPDAPKNQDEIMMSGLITPTSSNIFSGTNIDDVPYWILKNPKNTYIYVYCRNGKLWQISADLQTFTLIKTVASSSGNGAVYYDNYIYCASNTEIARYGPLNGTPSWNDTFWTNTCHAVSALVVAMSNTTYPAINNIKVPNHQILNHKGNRALYICDVISSSSVAADIGKGCLHYIKTTQTTVQGDTVNAANYAAVDFEWGYYPVCIENYKGNIAIGVIEGVDTDIDQANARLIIWDGLSETFSNNIELPDPLITGMKMVNGSLIIFTGNASGGCRILKYLGGYEFQELGFFEEATPPLQGSIDSVLNRVVFGTNIKYNNYVLSGIDPDTKVRSITKTSVEVPSVIAINSRSAKIPMGMHNILKANINETLGLVTAVKYLKQGSFQYQQPVFGTYAPTAKGALEKKSSTFTSNMWRSELIKIGTYFVIDSIKIPFVQKFINGMKFKLKFVVDDGTDVVELPEYDYANLAVKDGVELNSTLSGYPVVGKNNFYIQIDNESNVQLTFALPIIITYHLKKA